MTTTPQAPAGLDLGEAASSGGPAGKAGATAGARRPDGDDRRQRPVARKRVLALPPPPGRLEAVVRTAVEELADTYAPAVRKAEGTIAEYGLTIEATRIRDRLVRAARNDLQRILLATPGVTETLFNEAIRAQLEEEEQLGQGVRDESVAALGERIDAISQSLDKSLHQVSRSTQDLQESTRSIVDVLGRVADVLGARDDVEATAAEPPPTAPKAPRQRPPRSRKPADPGVTAAPHTDKATS